MQVEAPYLQETTDEYTPFMVRVVRLTSKVILLKKDADGASLTIPQRAGFMLIFRPAVFGPAAGLEASSDLSFRIYDSLARDLIIASNIDQRGFSMLTQVILSYLDANSTACFHSTILTQHGDSPMPPPQSVGSYQTAP